MAPVFQIQIDDAQEYHYGGTALSGTLILVVGGHTLSLKDVILRVLCDMETSIETLLENGKTRILKGSMRLYDGEMNLPLPQKHFPPGRHEIPFKFPLPADRPRLPPSATDIPQPTTYGHINFQLKAHARKSTSSWFSSGEIKAIESFMFMPPSAIKGEKSGSSALQQTVMNGYVGGAASDSAQADGFWSRLTGSGSKRRKEPPLEVQCLLSAPSEGLAQDRATQFRLRIVSSDPNEPIMVQSISLTLETIVTLVASGVRVVNTRSSQSLVDAKVLRSGSEVDVSDLLSAVEIRSRVLPTFQTPLITFNYALVLQVSLLRHSHRRGESATLMQRLPIRVLSPRIQDGEQGPALAEKTQSSDAGNAILTASSHAQFPPEKSRFSGAEYAKPQRKPVPSSSGAQLMPEQNQSLTGASLPPDESSTGNANGGATPASVVPAGGPVVQTSIAQTSAETHPVSNTTVQASHSAVVIPIGEDTQPTGPPPAYSE